MKKAFAILFLFVLTAQAWAAVNFDFSAVNSGNTLYYKITSDTEDSKEVSVVYPNYQSSDYYDGYTKPTGSLIIPAKVTNSSTSVEYNVTSIGGYAFYECSSLTSVTISNSVTSIGSSAFRGCSGLTTVTIGNSVTSIGGSAFYNCSGLTSVTIPNSVTSIGGYAFYNCSGLTSVTIPNSVTSIGIGAFNICSSLTSVTIGNSVTSIGNEAFFGCRKLTEINVESANTNYTSENGILFNKDKTTIVCYPAGKTETTYTIPNSVTSIGGSAFSGCSGLTSVTIGNSVTSIGSSAFYNCRGLTSVTIPNSVTSIGSDAFSSCSGLTSVTIPNSVTSIGSEAFSGCSGLTDIAYDGTSAPTIRTDAFLDVNSSVKVCVPENYSSASFGGISVCKGLVHNNATEPTCTETGLTEGVHCSNCGRVFVAQEETAPALGHLFTNYIYNNDATTEADGTETAECDHGCGTTDTRVSAGTRLPDNPTAVTSTDRNALSISVVRGAIVVNNAASDIVVYDTAGRIVARQKPQQQNVIAVANRGLYIVKSGNAVERVIVNDCYK